MASPDRGYYAGARLAFGMSSFSGAFPHADGTQVGLVHDIRLDPGMRYVALEDEEHGEVFEILHAGGNPALQIVLAQWDEDALAAFLPHSRTDTGDEVMLFGSTNADTARRAGSRVSDYAVKLLVEADESATVPSLVFYAACPLLELNQAMLWSVREPLTVALNFVGIRDSDGKIGEVGLLSKLTSP